MISYLDYIRIPNPAQRAESMAVAIDACDWPKFLDLVKQCPWAMCAGTPSRNRADLPLTQALKAMAEFEARALAEAIPTQFMSHPLAADLAAQAIQQIPMAAAFAFLSLGEEAWPAGAALGIAKKVVTLSYGDQGCRFGSGGPRLIPCDPKELTLLWTALGELQAAPLTKYPATTPATERFADHAKACWLHAGHVILTALREPPTEWNKAGISERIGADAGACFAEWLACGAGHGFMDVLAKEESLSLMRSIQNNTVGPLLMRRPVEFNGQSFEPLAEAFRDAMSKRALAGTPWPEALGTLLGIMGSGRPVFLAEGEALWESLGIADASSKPKPVKAKAPRGAL